MVQVGVYPTRGDAEFAQAALAGAGIPSVLAADDAGGAYPFVLSGEAHLLVDEADVEEAAAILADRSPPRNGATKDATTGGLLSETTGQVALTAGGAHHEPRPGAAVPTKEVFPMSVRSDAPALESTPRYLITGDPALADYYPAWLDSLADDVTVEGSMLDGAVQGVDAVRTIVVGIRSMYGDSQEFHFAGPCGDNSWLEDYIARVDGSPLGCVVLVTRNAAGQTQHIVASYRPRSSVLLFAGLLGEKFAGTPLASYFISEGAA